MNPPIFLVSKLKVKMNWKHNILYLVLSSNILEQIWCLRSETRHLCSSMNFKILNSHNCIGILSNNRKSKRIFINLNFILLLLRRYTQDRNLRIRRLKTTHICIGYLKNKKNILGMYSHEYRKRSPYFTNIPSHVHAFQIRIEYWLLAFSNFEDKWNS